MADSRARKLVNMKFPAGFAHAYEKADPETGEIREKAILTFPNGMRAEGHDLSRWYLVAFRTPRMNRQIEEDAPVVLSVKAWKEGPDGELVENTLRAFRGSGQDAEWIDLNPWAVACGLRDLRSRSELGSRPHGRRHEGNAETGSAGDSYGGDGDDQVRTGGRTNPPRTSVRNLDDSFAGRMRRMKQAAAAQEH